MSYSLSKIILTLVLLTTNVFAYSVRENWLQIIPNNGSLVYRGEVVPDRVRTTERVNFTTVDGQKRIKELRAQQFTCIRSNQLESLCTQILKIQQLPESVKAFVDKKMLGFGITFTELVNEPILKIDTSTEKEWQVFQNVKIGETIIQRYKLAYVYENKNYYIALPTSSEQPISVLQIIDSERVLLQMVTSSTVGKQNIGYIFSLLLRK